MKSQHEDILDKYSYKKEKPLLTANNYTVW